MQRAATVIVATLLAATGARTGAADGAPALAPLLVGNTLSAVAYVPHPAGLPGGGELSRFMFQAYLRQNGSALVRVWDTGRDAYTAPAEREWTLSGSTLCLNLPDRGPGMVCAEIHVWGPRIAGIGTKPYAMLDGDLEPGNAIAAIR